MKPILIHNDILTANQIFSRIGGAKTGFTERLLAANCPLFIYKTDKAERVFRACYKDEFEKWYEQNNQLFKTLSRMRRRAA